MLTKYIIDNRIQDAIIDETFLMSAFFLIIINNDYQWFQKILNGTWIYSEINYTSLLY